MGVRISNKTDENFKFSEGFIQNALNGFFAINSVRYNIDNLYIFDWESDKLLETRSGYIYEFEIKISKADFKNDFKHKTDKHIILSGEERYGDKYLPRYYEILKANEAYGDWAVKSFHKNNDENPYYLVGAHKRPNYFYYAVPTGLINVEDVPEYAGLIYVNEKNGLTIVKKAPQLHKDKYNDNELKLGEKFYYNMDKWRERCKRSWSECKLLREKLDAEIEANGQGRAYKDLQDELESYKKAFTNESMSKDQVKKELYRKNRMLAALAHKLQKYDPEFNLFKFEDEYFGK